MSELELPPGVPAGGPDIGEDPDGAERHGLDLLSRTGEEILAGVSRAVPAWSVREVARILDAWGGHDAGEREALLRAASAAGERAAERVVSELGELFRLDPLEQRVTPLQLVRTVYREPTEVLREAGVPAVVRGEFAERSFPDDDYGLVPDTLADLGDEDLAPLHLAWGVAKATVHKARRARIEGGT